MVNFYWELFKEFLYETDPMEFYRDIFPKGELDTKDSYTKGKFVGIACEFTKDKRENGIPIIKRHTITDDLDTIKKLLKSKNFVIVSPISYIGKERTTVNARVMYAFAIEIDGIKVNEGKVESGFDNLIHQMNKGFLPKCNYIVASGNGLHLYYLLEKPLFLYPNVKKSLINFKKNITPRFWNSYVTKFYKREKIQNESAFQGFRLAGGYSKRKERTKIFKMSEKRCSIEYLNSFVTVKNSYIIPMYKTDLSLEQAKEKYPEWYEKKVVNKLPKGKWLIKRDLYDWWLKRIINETTVGHRYYNLMILSIYAIKCGISYKELSKDCYSLLKKFDLMSKTKDNRFTEKDVISALQVFEDKDLVNFSINSITKLSGLHIEKNKRNGRKQEEHIKIMNAIRDIIKPNGEWRNKEGRPKGSGIKKELIQEWKLKNPLGTKYQCKKETGLSKNTIKKWW